jgi:hypothetical protein
MQQAGSIFYGDCFIPRPPIPCGRNVNVRVRSRARHPTNASTEETGCIQPSGGRERCWVADIFILPHYTGEREGEPVSASSTSRLPK